MAYRDDVEALNARHSSLAQELASKTRELADAARLIDEARTRAKLPILDNIRVATPCSADWTKMSGDERVRACGDCKKSVYNLSDLTRDEAQALLIELNGKLCARYFQRTDGTILLKDCSIGVARKRKHKVIAASAAALLACIGGWIVLSRPTEPEAHCINSNLRDQPTRAVRVVGHETAPADHTPMMGDVAF
ncbi:hypothetical protein BH11MYX3_BH11MYX3_09390 [soil metagenome]